MRPMALIACASLLLTALAALPTAQARTVYCVDATNPHCPGDVCVDTSLDGSIQPNECITFYCGVAGCCDPCPPPDAAPLCASKKIGGTPVAVTVEYGVGCTGLTYTTCKLQYYPGEPNTPVWVCTTKRVV